MSNYVPNSFQIPNAYVDCVWHLLTAEEVRVLTYMCRRIFGFNRRSDRISITQITDGLVSRKTGQQLDNGCGISRGSAIKALDGLKSARLIIEVSPNDQTLKQGACYELQMESDDVDIAWLEERKAARDSAQRQRTELARSVSATDRSFRPEIGKCDRPEIGKCDRPEIGKCDRPIHSYKGNTEGNTEENQSARGAQSGSKPPKGSIEVNPHWVWLKGMCGYGLVVPGGQGRQMQEAVHFLESVAATEEQRNLFQENWPRFWKSKPPQGRKRPYPGDIPVDWLNVLELEITEQANEQSKPDRYKSRPERDAENIAASFRLIGDLTARVERQQDASTSICPVSPGEWISDD